MTVEEYLLSVMKINLISNEDINGDEIETVKIDGDDHKITDVIDTMIGPVKGVSTDLMMELGRTFEYVKNESKSVNFVTK